MLTRRLTLVPQADEHLELDSDPEVTRYLSGRALSPVDVERSHHRRRAASREVPRPWVEYEITRTTWQRLRPEGLAEG